MELLEAAVDGVGAQRWSWRWVWFVGQEVWLGWFSRVPVKQMRGKGRWFSGGSATMRLRQSCACSLEWRLIGVCARVMVEVQLVAGRNETGRPVEGVGVS